MVNAMRILSHGKSATTGTLKAPFTHPMREGLMQDLIRKVSSLCDLRVCVFEVQHVLEHYHQLEFSSFQVAGANAQKRPFQVGPQGITLFWITLFLPSCPTRPNQVGEGADGACPYSPGVDLCRSQTPRHLQKVTLTITPNRKYSVAPMAATSTVQVRELTVSSSDLLLMPQHLWCHAVTSYMRRESR